MPYRGSIQLDSQVQPGIRGLFSLAIVDNVTKSIRRLLGKIYNNQVRTQATHPLSSYKLFQLSPARFTRQGIPSEGLAVTCSVWYIFSPLTVGVSAG